MSEINLGDKVECIHSGFKGVAVDRVTFINQCVQYIIVQSIKGDTRPEYVGIDEQSLIVIAKNKNEIINHKCIDIELGDVVQCRYTGFKGVAVTKVEALNGTISYGVLSKMGKDGKMPEPLDLDQNHLRIVKKKNPVKKKEDENIKSNVKRKTKTERPTRRTGGPMSRNMNNRRGF